MNKKQHDPKFISDLRQLVLKLRPKYRVQDVAAILRIPCSVLYRWMHGVTTPIWLARRAAIAVLLELRKELPPA